MNKKQQLKLETAADPPPPTKESPATNKPKLFPLQWKRLLPLGILVILLPSLAMTLWGIQSVWDRSQVPQNSTKSTPPADESGKYGTAQAEFNTAKANLQKARETYEKSDKGSTSNGDLQTAEAVFQKANTDWQKTQTDHENQQRVVYGDDVRIELTASSARQERWGILLVLATILGIPCVNFLLHKTFSPVRGQEGNLMGGTGAGRTVIYTDEEIRQAIDINENVLNAIASLNQQFADLKIELQEGNRKPNDTKPVKVTGLPAPSLEDTVQSVIGPHLAKLAEAIEILRREFRHLPQTPSHQPLSIELPQDITGLPSQVASLATTMERQQQQTSADMKALQELLMEQMAHITEVVGSLSTAVRSLQEQANRNISANEVRPSSSNRPHTEVAVGAPSTSGSPPNRALENTIQNRQRNGDSGGMSSSSPNRLAGNWQEELRVKFAQFDTAVQQSTRKYKDVPSDRDILADVYDWLIQKWPAFLARLEGGDVINIKAHLSNVDRALYLPLHEVLKTPTQSGEGNRDFGADISTIRDLLIQAQLARREEMQLCNMERIEAPEGSARVYNNEWAVDTEVEAPEALKSEWAGKLCTVRPGKGGYRSKGGVVVPSSAVYYKS